MQTFLPFADYRQSARALDDKRLGKQRVEGLQILNTLLGLSKGWANHPAVRMWQGYEYELCKYIFAVCAEWVERGFDDSVSATVGNLFEDLPICSTPTWFGDERLHSSHRSNLYRKDSSFYRQFAIDAGKEYWWPI